MTLARGTVAARAVLDQRAIHIADLQAEAEEYPEGREFALRFGHRTILAVPLIRAATAIGVINVRLDWISCLRAPQISALAQDQGALQMSLGSEQTVAAYKSLALVERAFRTLKGVDMQVRPIYHCLSAGRLVRTT